jgi:hypothetical protein
MMLDIFMLTPGLSEHYEVGPESFGVVVCRLAGTEPGICGVVWISFISKSEWESKIPGRVLKRAQALLV